MAVAVESCYHITAQGTKTHYTRCGTGPEQLLILLHGLGGSSETFTPLLPHLPLQSYNVLSVDLEGFGATQLTNSNAPLSIGRHVADLESLISHLAINGALEAPECSHGTPVVIIGHSLGSIIALQYASRCPGKVRGLGLLGVGRSASHIPAARERMLSMAATVRNEGIAGAAELATQTNVPPGVEGSYARNEVRKAVMATDPEGYAKTCEAMVSPDHKDPDYATVNCPTVFITGEHDTISPPSRAEDLAPLIGGRSTVYRVHGGHQPILSDLEGTRAAISQLFAQIDG